MSDTDSFIDEVTEEVRRDRLFALMRKYGWIAILLVVLIVGGAAYSEWQKSTARASAEAFGDAVIAAMAADDPAARVAALDALKTTTDGNSSRIAVLEMLAAAESVAGDNRDVALSRLNTVAADTALPDSVRQLAQLKAVVLAGDTMSNEERTRLLDGLAMPGAPFRPLAMEQQALALMDAGNGEAAVALLRQILQEPNVTAGLRRRATQLIVALGADPDAV